MILEFLKSCLCPIWEEKFLLYYSFYCKFSELLPYFPKPCLKTGCYRIVLLQVTLHLGSRCSFCSHLLDISKLEITHNGLKLLSKIKALSAFAVSLHSTDTVPKCVRNLRNHNKGLLQAHAYLSKCSKYIWEAL